MIYLYNMQFKLKRNLCFTNKRRAEDILYLITKEVTAESYIGIDYYGNFMVYEKKLNGIVGRFFELKNPRLYENDLINLSKIEWAMNQPEFIAFTIDPKCEDLVTQYKIKNNIQ